MPTSPLTWPSNTSLAAIAGLSCLLLLFRFRMGTVKMADVSIVPAGGSRRLRQAGWSFNVEPTPQFHELMRTASGVRKGVTEQLNKRMGYPRGGEIVFRNE